MNQLMKSAVMAAALVLVLALVLFLKGIVAEDAETQVHVPGEFQDRVSSSEARVKRQPTILQAKPASPEGPPDSVASPRYPRSPAGNISPPASAAEADGEYARDPRGFGGPARQSTGSPWRPEEATGWPDSPRQAPSNRIPRGDSPADSAVDAQGQSAVGATPEDQSAASYSTKADDSFWSISEEIYGSGEFYKALYYHNREKIRSPDRIEAGISIEVPAAQELRRMYPQLSPER